MKKCWLVLIALVVATVEFVGSTALAAQLDPEDLREIIAAYRDRVAAIVRQYGGTISHQHGVGADHLAYLAAEKGPLGMQTLARLREQYDPRGLMNPGKLLLP